MLYFGLQPSTNVPTGTQVNMTPVINLSNDPAAMVEYLNTLLLHGTMSAAMKAEIVKAVEFIPNTASDYQRRRAQTAIYLVATSAQYEVQR
jgi:hypothetical protein